MVTSLMPTDNSTDAKHRAVGSLYLATAVYLVWKERNYRLHNPGVQHASGSTIFNLKRITRERLFSCIKFKNWVHHDPSLICYIY